MAARKKLPDTITLLILRDGVFIADDERRDEGDQCPVRREIANILIERGHAQRV